MVRKAATVTAGEIVAKALRLWTEERRTGILLFNFRHGTLRHVEHQVVEFPEGELKSARGQMVPRCPACGGDLTSRDAGAMWTCDACGVKRTSSQLKAVK